MLKIDQRPEDGGGGVDRLRRLLSSRLARLGLTALTLAFAAHGALGGGADRSTDHASRTTEPTHPYSASAPENPGSDRI